MGFKSQNGMCDIIIDDVEELADITGGALVRHPSGKLDITCKTHLNNDVPRCSWSLQLLATSEKELREEFAFTCSELRDAGQEAIDVLKERHPDWEFPEL